VDEHFGSVFTADKSISLGVVEPLDRALQLTPPPKSLRTDKIVLLHTNQLRSKLDQASATETKYVTKHRVTYVGCSSRGRATNSTLRKLLRWRSEKSARGQSPRLTTVQWTSCNDQFALWVSPMPDERY